MKAFNSVQDIQKERMQMRDNKTIYTLLGVLIGEIDRLPTRSEPTADQIYQVVNRMYNNAKEMAQYNETSVEERDYLQDFIKVQLTDAELIEIILGYKDSGLKVIGDFMRALSSEYKGRYDGKNASRLINQILNS